jgi:hypothetical protein
MRHFLLLQVLLRGEVNAYKLCDVNVGLNTPSVVMISSMISAVDKGALRTFAPPLSYLVILGEPLR